MHLAAALLVAALAGPQMEAQPTGAPDDVVRLGDAFNRYEARYESRRHPGNRVLRDGLSFVWVTGRPPKGLTFSLNPTSLADCSYRLEVVRWVETEQGLPILDAETMRLPGRTREER
jgi:hypothetical protein